MVVYKEKAFTFKQNSFKKCILKAHSSVVDTNRPKSKCGMDCMHITQCYIESRTRCVGIYFKL
jgi:hypothetical protein